MKIKIGFSQEVGYTITNSETNTEITKTYLKNV